MLCGVYGLDHPVQWKLAITVLCVHGSSLIERYFHRVGISSRSGAVEGYSTIMVVMVNTSSMENHVLDNTKVSLRPSNMECGSTIQCERKHRACETVVLCLPELDGLVHLFSVFFLMLKGFQEQDFTVLRRSTHELLRNNRAEIAELKIFSNLNDQFGKGTLDILQFSIIQRSIDTILLPPGTMLRHPSVDKMILDRMYPSNNRADGQLIGSSL